MKKRYWKEDSVYPKVLLLSMKFIQYFVTALIALLLAYLFMNQVYGLFVPQGIGVVHPFDSSNIYSIIIYYSLVIVVGIVTAFQTNQFNDVKKLNIIESTLITGGVFTLTYILISQVYKFIAFGFTVSESETVRGSDVPINFCLLITLVISSNIIRIIQNK